MTRMLLLLHLLSFLSFWATTSATLRRVTKNPTCDRQQFAHPRGGRRLQDRSSCIQNPQEFETDLLISHLGSFELLNASDFSTLEQAILEGYNELSLSTSNEFCDPQFRNLTQVIADDESIQPVPLTASTSGEFVIRYKIKGVCDGCLGETSQAAPLFGIDHPVDALFSSNSHSKSSKSSKSSHSSSKSSSSKSSKSSKSRANKGPCDCTGRGPRERDVQEAINLQLIWVQSELPGIYDVTSLAEAQEITCSEDVATFSSTSLLMVHGEPTSMTASEMQGVERTFVASYNQLSFDQCDTPYFRRLSDASAEPLASLKKRKLNSVSSSARIARRYSLLPFDASKVIKISSEGHCRDCPTDSISLFGQQASVSSRRRQLQEKDIPWFLLEGRQESDPDALADTCFCSAKNINASGVPTVEDFQNYYNNELDDNILENIRSVEKTIEVSEVECDSNAKTLESVIFLEVDARIEYLDDDDRRDLSLAFLKAYNELLFYACDTPHFRTAIDVSIDKANSDAWLGRQPLPLGLDWWRLMKVSTKFACRDCTSNSSMFDLEQDSALAFDIPRYAFSQEVQPDGGICFCPFDASSKAEATARVFRDVYNSLVGQLDFQDFDSVSEVLEVEPFSCGNETTLRSSHFFIHFESDPSNSTVDAIFALEQKMTNTYNALNFETCDNPYFRTALSFQVVEIQDNNVALVIAQYECRFCESFISMLTWAAGMTSDISPASLSDLGNDTGFYLSSSSVVVDTCYCRKNETESRSPSEDEFTNALTGVLDVVEFQYLACPVARYAFQTEIYIQLGENVTISESEAAVIQSTFIETYNTLNFLLCDSQHYRRVLSVEVGLLSKAQRRQQEEDLFEEFTEGEVLNILRLVVDVECRDCTTETTMFTSDNATTDSVELPAVTPSSSLLSMLANGEDIPETDGLCRCSATFPSIGRAPTADEFRRVFNRTILSLDVQELEASEGEGFQPSEEVVEVIEVKPVDCDEEISQFTSTVFVGLVGDINLLSAEEKRALEGSFQETFNFIAFSRCDSYFRQVSRIYNQVFVRVIAETF